jgi:endonuclease VIII
MPEGDTLYRIAGGLRPYLIGRPVIAASARQPGPRAEALLGATITSVESRGKHLLIRFDTGLELRSHLGLRGSWHRYSPAERWRRPPSRARIVLEVPGAVAVCFDAPTVELFESRTEPIHQVLSVLGPDLLDPEFTKTGEAEALRRLRDSARASMTIAEALLDQQALAGIGNVYKNEVLFIERVDPFRAVGDVDEDVLRDLVRMVRRLLIENLGRASRITTDPGVAGGRGQGRLWVYGRSGRPCRRCGATILDRRHGRLNRRTFWCPGCQPASVEEQR